MAAFRTWSLSRPSDPHTGLRPVKPLHFHRTKSNSHNRKDKEHQSALLKGTRVEAEGGHAAPFDPYLPPDLPFFPLLGGSEAVMGTGMEPTEYHVGSKRPLDAAVNVPTGGGGTDRGGNGRGGGRKRGGAGGVGKHAGHGWGDVDMDGHGGAAADGGGEERDRKRVARR